MRSRNPQPHQPSWAAPQRPGDDTVVVQPPRKRKVGKFVGFGCLVPVAIFFLLAAIGAAMGGGNKSSNAGASTSPSPTKTSAAPTQAAKTTAPAKPTPAAKTAAPVQASATISPTPKQASADARKKAAAILEKEDQDFRDFLAKGEDVVGTPQYTSWYNKAVVGLDMQQNAFKKADAYFTADNEPTDLLEAWRADNGDGNAAITQFGSDGLSPDAPDAATRKDASDCLAALAKADKDAEKIAKGS
ncbi:hypothetical protein M878_30625 [Streptomyces roseochromogenus subsp. oscitans DS 12.976]|uniref:Uncharacterized protein n=2 Tax=Streptomyces roseochromogenus TaxID=285450 RepID=V6JZ10_STRRC|nr:hypothetical protein M878_30625 [Streptomyces roseochromogenus subsp. oscitans DS 12.976]